MTVAEPPVLLEKNAAVARLTINRPDILNAMDSHAHLALSEALDEVTRDDAIRVIILTGAGRRAFSVGRDLKEMAAEASLSAADRQALAGRWRRIRRLTDRHDLFKPIIARVNGVALGGGFELVLACDIAIATEEASFALPEAKRGIIPFAGGVHRLPRQLPLKIAMGHLLTGRPLSAARAYELGLVNEVVVGEALDETVEAWVAQILECAPLSVQSIKQCVTQGLAQPLGDAMKATYSLEELRKASDDSREGPRAFLERRAPRWSGT